MRPVPEVYRLSFLLPDGAAEPLAAASVASGTAITFHAAGLVVVTGPSREAVFDCAAEVLCLACRDLGACAVSACLMTPGNGFCGRDSWTVTVGADVAFSPTAMPPYVPPAGARAPPQLVAIDGGLADQG